jgi:hypothetical protein
MGGNSRGRKYQSINSKFQGEQRRRSGSNLQFLVYNLPGNIQRYLEFINWYFVSIYFCK